MKNRITPTDPTIAISALVKGEERYIILYDDASRQEAIQQTGRWAGNPELSFSWYDAAYLARSIRKEGKAVQQ